MKVGATILTAVIFFGVHQGLSIIWELADRKVKYRAAEEYANSVGKPFLVVGGPWGVNPCRRLLEMPAHGGGDICIDINPDACEGYNFTQADIRNIPYPDKFFGAAFASHVLEHLHTEEDALLAVSELNRVADAIWIAYPRKDSIIAQLMASHYLWVSQNDGILQIEQRGG